MGKIIKEALILFAITLCAGILLGIVYQVTLDPIKKANENAKQKAYKAVLEDATDYEEIDKPSDSDVNSSSDIDFSKDTLEEIVVGKKDGQVVGYVITVTDGEGYGGDIKFSVGISPEGKVLGVSFLSINETAGLGMRAKQDPNFVKKFTSKTNPVESFKVEKGQADDNNLIDAIGGSTITTKSVTKGVNYALATFKYINENEGK